MGLFNIQTFKLQKKTIRTITCSRYNVHTDSIFKQLTFRRLNDINQLQQLKFMYKLQNHTLPLYFNTFSPKRHTDIHRHKTRQINQYLTCRTRHVFAQKCLRFDIPHLINNSPSNIINPFTTIHDGNFRRHSSCYVTIHDGNFRRIYYDYTRIPGSWHALRPGSEVVNKITTHSLYGFAFHIKLYLLNKYSDICRNTNCYVCNNV